ncbi:MAG: spore maturation protein A [Oscillospiraceae bacterium]|nr:spore maturation protein A [Oscillospiraceae bacterium]
MMKWVFCTLILLSIIFAIISGDVAAVSEAALAESGNAVTLAISLAGVICLWSGVMRIAQKAGVTEFLAAAFRPILSRLFRGINAKGKAMQYIVLNLTANLLGLGNASTPFGIAAMKELEKEEQTGEKASNNMILFVVMNTASLQIIPTTVAALRLKNGSSDPMEILPAVWIVSGVTLTITIIVTVILSKIMGRSKRKS